MQPKWAERRRFFLITSFWFSLDWCKHWVSHLNPTNCFFWAELWLVSVLIYSCINWFMILVCIWWPPRDILLKIGSRIAVDWVMVVLAIRRANLKLQFILFLARIIVRDSSKFISENIWSEFWDQVSRVSGLSKLRTNKYWWVHYQQNVWVHYKRDLVDFAFWSNSWKFCFRKLRSDCFSEFITKEAVSNWFR